jgi:hypothetical protein
MDQQSYSMNQQSHVERRKHRRYIVAGRVTFAIGSVNVSGELVNFGHGGMQIRTRHEVSANARLDFRVVAYCYPEMFTVPGQVVGIGNSSLSVKFLERTSGAKELLLWLERENYPWTGGNATAVEDPQWHRQGFHPDSLLSSGEIDVNASLECIFQDA